MAKPGESKTSRSTVADTGKAGVRYRRRGCWKLSMTALKRRESILPFSCPTACSTASSNSFSSAAVSMPISARGRTKASPWPWEPFLVGKKPVALMEGSGIGMSALILARGIVQKTPTMLIVGHNSTLGERYDYHGATRLVAEPVLRALDIPYHVLFDPERYPQRSSSRLKQPSKANAFPSDVGAEPRHPRNRREPMNRTDVLRYIASLRNGDPMIISPGLANYTIAEEKDEPLTIYNMDMPYATPMALGMALGWPERRVISIEGDGSLLAGPGVLSTVARYQPQNLADFCLR